MATNISDGTFSQFECSLSEDRHFLDSPCRIGCGHFACKQCLSKSIGSNIRCTKCQKTLNKMDYNREQNLKNEMSKHVNEMLKLIEKEFKNYINSIKGKN